MSIRYRWAGPEDAEDLGALNADLIRAEGHRNTMARPALAEPMGGFLSGGYRALIASAEQSTLGYLLARDDGDHLYVRQLYVVPGTRRRGIGRALVEELARSWGRGRRLRMEAHIGTAAALAFWRDLGFSAYACSLEREPGNAGDRTIASHIA
jgi:ribosomal protein S18 acetylase RimI-like enzyme